MSESKISFKERIDLGKESSLLVWYPIIKDLSIPQIQTEIVKIEHDLLYKFMAKNIALPKKVLGKCNKAMKKIGKYPMFMRTDQSSAKHEWKDTCFLESEKDFLSHLSRLVEYHELSNMAGELGYEAIVFREFLDLESYFTADYFGDFPINKEVRCFIKDRKLVSMHNYWFHKAVEQGHPHDRYWREKLQKLNLISDYDLDNIKIQLKQVCQVFKDYWSVDFAKGKDKEWYLLDMARGEVSFHPEILIGERKN